MVPTLTLFVHYWLSLSYLVTGIESVTHNVRAFSLPTGLEFPTRHIIHGNHSSCKLLIAFCYLSLRQVRYHHCVVMQMSSRNLPSLRRDTNTHHEDIIIAMNANFETKACMKALHQFSLRSSFIILRAPLLLASREYYKAYNQPTTLQHVSVREAWAFFRDGVWMGWSSSLSACARLAIIIKAADITLELKPRKHAGRTLGHIHAFFFGMRANIQNFIKAT